MMSSDTFAQKVKEPVNRILFIFDASQSMLGSLECQECHGP